MKKFTAATHDQQVGRQVAELQQNSGAGSSTHGAPTGRREHHVQEEEESASAAAAVIWTLGTLLLYSADETHVGWELEGNFVCIIVIRVSTIITKGYCGPKLFISSSVAAHITNWLMQQTTNLFHEMRKGRRKCSVTQM